MDLIIGIVFNVGLLLTAIFILFVNNEKVKIIVPTILLVLYSAVLAVGVFSDISFGDGVKVVWDFSGKWASKDIIWSPVPESMWGFLTNITMLVPIGLYIGTVCKKPLLKSVIIGFATGLFIEIMQFILPVPRFPQVSDIWLNGVSTILGCLYAMLFVWVKGKIKVKKNQNTPQNKEIESKIAANSIPIETNAPQEQNKSAKNKEPETNLEDGSENKKIVTDKN